VDPSAFTLTAVLDHYQEMDAQTFIFIIKCFYLRYKIKLFSKTMTIKEETAFELFRRYKLDRKAIYELNSFSTWNYYSQIQFGNLIVMLLVDIYKDIAHIARDVTGDVAPQDLTLLGRKLSASLKKKTHKIPVLHKPLDTLNLPSLTVRFNEGMWQVFPENDSSRIIVERKDLAHCLAYLAWNDLYFPGQLRMLPNKTSATIQDIINLIIKIKEIFGVYDISSIDFQNFLQREYMEKMLFIINFAGNQNAETIQSLSVISLNNWGELFVNRFNSPEKFHSYLENISQSPYYMEKYFHIQRNALNYENILKKTMRMVSHYVIDRSDTRLHSKG